MCLSDHVVAITYKTHRSVDMQSGLINKIAVTPANVGSGLKSPDKIFRNLFPVCNVNIF